VLRGRHPETLARGLVFRPRSVYTLGVEAPQTQFDAERKAAFVAAYEDTGEKKAAAASVGVTRQTIYNHIASDPEFRDACEAARGRLLGKLTRTLKKLAIDGVTKKTYDKDGDVVSETKQYDVRALLAWLKRLEREKWGDKVAVDQTVNATVTNKHEITPAQLDRTQRNRVRDLLDALPEEPSKN